MPMDKAAGASIFHSKRHNNISKWRLKFQKSVNTQTGWQPACSSGMSGIARKKESNTSKPWGAHCLSEFQPRKTFLTSH